MEMIHPPWGWNQWVNQRHCGMPFSTVAVPCPLNVHKYNSIITISTIVTPLEK
jgi:hypothetical protein